MHRNLLPNLTEKSVAPFQWTNPAPYTLLPGGGICIAAPARTDYFRDPGGKVIADSAPYLYLQAEGDFIMQAQVSHPFQSVYDAAALMVRADAEHWVKLCFECSDFNTHAVVSVVTNGVSDDANGVNYHWPSVWLQIIRKGNTFGLHYAPDGETWNMVRYCTIPAASVVSVGMVAQSPVGEGAQINFLHFSLEHRTAQDARAGQ